MGEDDGSSDYKPDEEGKVTSSNGPPSSGPPSSGPPSNGPSNGGSMLAGLNIRSKKSVVASSTTTSTSISGNNQDVTEAEQKFQDDLAKAMAESMQESPFADEGGVDLSAMDSLPKSTLTSEEPTSSSSSSAAATATTTKVPSSGISAARRPSYTAAGRSSRASTLENMSTSDGSDAQKSTSERLSSEIYAFGSTVERFQSQVIHFSKRKVALSEQKVLLEENTSALLQELATAETAQNHAIESEDYEEAETFNSTIADVQNRQSRNASELR